MTTTIEEGRRLVDAMRDAARRHASHWEALVPDASTVNAAAEEAEETAYAEMALAKRALRDHICATYGITPRELSSLAIP
ncbi:hypothetical protein [Rhizorhabdus dicambivorans]|uniref:Uncharacterized protein n=1 Tax=Rhizorhabdus dicambivorans TaxID=1850238 RepID=A0A2A4FW37_9SPHN|nr:hypothetical protein [Rhizorhabdus dicambivorans]ATE65563.1 hypothetical protein CMV14_15100 [Rhizorhabdus dicambivorans]PCE41906.1 hypothetical protein COO09_12855 [Rhizorhabdus dicambivorans]